MIKFLKSNWREAISVVVLICVLLVGILSLGTREVSGSGPLSAALSVAVSLLGGIAKFAVCLGLAWLGLAITFPEAARYVFGEEFDGFWVRCPGYVKFYVSVSGAAVLAIVAALCMASS